MPVAPARGAIAGGIPASFAGILREEGMPGRIRAWVAPGSAAFAARPPYLRCARRTPERAAPLSGHPILGSRVGRLDRDAAGAFKPDFLPLNLELLDPVLKRLVRDPEQARGRAQTAAAA